MSLYKQLENDVKASLKDGNAVRVSVLRMVISAIKILMIEKNVREVGDGDVLQIIQKHIKQHKESIAQFEKGNRKDLVNKEQEELVMLEAYMPKQLSEDELKAIVKDTIVETGLSSKSDKGKVMKAVLDKVKGRADGKIVNDLVSAMLG